MPKATLKRKRKETISDDEAVEDRQSRDTSTASASGTTDNSTNHKFQCAYETSERFPLRDSKNYISQGYTVSPKAMAMADKLKDLQFEPPSIDLLNAINVLGCHRIFHLNQQKASNYFRQSSLFALGMMMDEWTKIMAEEAAEAERAKEKEMIIADVTKKEKAKKDEKDIEAEISTPAEVQTETLTQNAKQKKIQKQKQKQKLKDNQ